jgi:ADP-ribose pyrophosphatase
MEKPISSKIVFECPIFKVEEAEVELDDGTIAKRWYVVRRDAVLVVCYRNGKIIMLREYRSASQSVEWRIPAGGVKEGESPQAAAIRETREEIGLEPLDAKLLQTFRNPSSTVKQTIHCFVATKFKENPLASGEKEEEGIEVKELSVDEIEILLEKEEFTGSIGKCLRLFIQKLKS